VAPDLAEERGEDRRRRERPPPVGRRQRGDEDRAPSGVGIAVESKSPVGGQDVVDDASSSSTHPPVAAVVVVVLRLEGTDQEPVQTPGGVPVGRGGIVGVLPQEAGVVRTDVGDGRGGDVPPLGIANELVVVGRAERDLRREGADVHAHHHDAAPSSGAWEGGWWIGGVVVVVGSDGHGSVAVVGTN
jgi:hypothetical protein